MSEVLKLQTSKRVEAIFIYNLTIDNQVDTVLSIKIIRKIGVTVSFVKY